jgi:alpha-ribazole phosphatase
VNIYLLRHGATGLSGNFVGTTDIPLSEEGISQAKKRCSVISPLFFDRVYCSPLLRCRQTVDCLALDQEIIEAEDLREVDFGHWEGLSASAIEGVDPAGLSRWHKEAEKFHFPGGESIPSFNNRVSGWFDDLARQRWRSVLIVSHGGVIRHGLCHLLGIQTSSAQAFKVAEAGLAVVEYEQGYGRLIKLDNMV